MENFDRTLDILVNGRLVRNYARARLFGKERLGLYPSLFMLSLWNIPEDEYLLLSRAHEITIKHGEVILASGAVADVFRYSERKGTEVQVAFSPGLMLWGSSVSLDVAAGTRVSEIVSQLLDRSGAGVELLSFPGEDPIVTRGQAFFGRASECIEEILSKAEARCCLVPSGLCVIPKKGLPVSMVLTEEDLTEPPFFTCGPELVLRTGPAGWTLGKHIEYRYGWAKGRGLIEERMLNLDTDDSTWMVELLVTNYES